MAKTIFHVSKPFSVPFLRAKKRGSIKRVNEDRLIDFWKQAKAYSTKKGCYIFALRASKGFMPWYIGKTTKMFKDEVLNPYQLKKYNEVLFDDHKGTPVMFFVYSKNVKGRISKKTIDELETFLIQTASSKNGAMVNKTKKTDVPEWGIQGVANYGKGKPNNESRQLKKLIGLG